MNHQPLVSIVIPNYNSRNDLKNCLESLRGVKYDEKEVIVVDSGSMDGSAQMVIREFPEAKLIRTEKMGIGEANNVGIKAAKGDFIVFDLNSDDVVSEDWLIHMIDAARASPDIGIVCGKRLLKGHEGIIDSAGATINLLTGTVAATGRGKKDSPKYDSLEEVDYVAVPMVKREVFEKVGLCDPEYYVYYEETDFCMRAKRAGYRILYVPSAIFWHRRSATLGKQNPRKHYYDRRNRIRFIAKNFPSYVLILPLLLHLVLMTMLYTFFYSLKADFAYIQAEKNAIAWNCSNMRGTMKARYGD